MRILYNFVIQLITFLLGIVSVFNRKVRQFVDGRAEVFDIIKKKINPADKVIWFHCASLGEYEQGLPIMDAVKTQFPAYKILVTFFSPSGYNIKKNSTLADCVVYLPLDTIGNAIKFISLVHPSLAIFIKYEIWPNFLFELGKNNIPSLLVSGIFRKEQIYFRTYGDFMIKALKTFSHIFLQDQRSLILLDSIDITKTTISGDTRFDRVFGQKKSNNFLAFMPEFKGDCFCIVCGSTWLEDENILVDYINSSPKNLKFVIAPHKIESLKILSLRNKIEHATVLYTERTSKNLSSYKVLIIDTIGLLSRLYQYAEIAYIGGAMGKSGLHNILEPATFGVPIVIGRNFEKFPEAKQLEQLGGLFAVQNREECQTIFEQLIENPTLRMDAGKKAEDYILENTGATQKVMEYISLMKDKKMI